MFLIIFISLFPISILAGDVFEPYPSAYISLIRYHVVESNQEGTTLTRILKLEVKNMTSQTLNNVSATIEGLPENAISNDTKVFLGDIGAGATVISGDSFHVSSTVSQQNNPNLMLRWKIQYYINEVYNIDETTVIESLQ